VPCPIPATDPGAIVAMLDASGVGEATAADGAIVAMLDASGVGEATAADGVPDRAPAAADLGCDKGIMVAA
jgi:hypothetical protein